MNPKIVKPDPNTPVRVDAMITSQSILYQMEMNMRAIAIIPIKRITISIFLRPIISPSIGTEIMPITKPNANIDWIVDRICYF